MSKRPTHRRDQQASRDLQQLLPARLRLTDDSAAEEDWSRCCGDLISHCRR